ncbi:MAG: DUF2442 domain-containing protein [Pseudomonadota bacterium]
MTKVDLPLVDVIRLRPLPGFKLWLRFTDGREGVRDLNDILDLPGPMVQPLKDPSFFKRVFIEGGVPTWPNGFDLDPIQLYMELRSAGGLSVVATEVPNKVGRSERSSRIGAGSNAPKMAGDRSVGPRAKAVAASAPTLASQRRTKKSATRSTTKSSSKS